MLKSTPLKRQASFNGYNKKGILVPDPRTKILLLLGINIFVFTNSHVYAEMLVVAALVILFIALWSL